VRVATGGTQRWAIADRRRYALLVVALAGVYYAAAKLGLSLAFTTPSVTAVWPPTGIALAALLVFGYRLWPGIALGAFLANAWTDVPLYTALGITIGNTLEALVGAYLLNRVAGFRPSLDRVRDVLALFAFAGVLSTMVSATIGTTSLLVGDEIASGDFGVTWRTWWLGDMGGDLVVATALLALVSHWPYRDVPGHPAEAIGLAALVGGTTAIVFANDVPMSFLIVPPLILVALRFAQPGAAIASLLVAAIAIPLTENDSGPFAGQSPDERLLLAQGLIGVSTITALVLAAVITERRRAERTLEQIAGTLQESLLPREVPLIPGADIAVYYRPAGERQLVGGDFYDVFEVDDAWAMVVGDALGKGAAAAATTALARYTLRAAAVHERRPSRILQELNDALLRENTGQSCTVAFARFELGDDRSASLTLSSGGHPPSMVLRADASVETVDGASLVLGVEPDPGLADSAVELRAGESLIVYTDGLTDAFAPRRIVTRADLAAVVARCADLNATETAQLVTRELLADRRGRPRDDVLLLVLRIPPVV
jgi:integral membrane sensor domain MASE1